MDEWDLLRLHVVDPQLAEVIEAALSPLDVDDDDGDEPVVVPVAILDEIAEHAAGVEPGFESTGALVIREHDNVAVRYERLPNVETTPGRFRVRPWRAARSGERDVLVHSHPSAGATPSHLDLAGATRSTLGIFASGALYLWRLDGRSFTGQPVEVVDVAPDDPTAGDPELETLIAQIVEADERLRHDTAKTSQVTASADAPMTLLGEFEFVERRGGKLVEIGDVTVVERRR